MRRRRGTRQSRRAPTRLRRSRQSGVSGSTPADGRGVARRSTTAASRPATSSSRECRSGQHATALDPLGRGVEPSLACMRSSAPRRRSVAREVAAAVAQPRSCPADRREIAASVAAVRARGRGDERRSAVTRPSPTRQARVRAAGSATDASAASIAAAALASAPAPGRQLTSDRLAVVAAAVVGESAHDLVAQPRRQPASAQLTRVRERHRLTHARRRRHGSGRHGRGMRRALRQRPLGDRRVSADRRSRARGQRHGRRQCQPPRRSSAGRTRLVVSRALAGAGAEPGASDSAPARRSSRRRP